jgi:hypothetical protein
LSDWTPVLQVNKSWRKISFHLSSESGLSKYIKQVETQMKEARNERGRMMTEFGNFDKKTNQLFNQLTTIMKGTREIQLAVMRNLQ